MTQKRILFNPKNSICKRAFKFHLFNKKTELFISLKAIEYTKESSFSEKLFIGDDRDRIEIIVKRKKTIWFQITDKTLEERLRLIARKSNRLVFVFEEINETNRNKLIDFYEVKNENREEFQGIEEFPKQLGLFQELYQHFKDEDENVNWDEIC